MSNYRFNRDSGSLASELAEIRSRADAKYNRDAMREYAQQQQDTVNTLSARMDAASRQSTIETIISTGSSIAKGGFDLWKHKRAARIKKLKDYSDVPEAEQIDEEDFKKNLFEDPKEDKGTMVDRESLYADEGINNKGTFARLEPEPVRATVQPESKEQDLSIFDEPEEAPKPDMSGAPAPGDYVDLYDQEATSKELTGKTDKGELSREDKDFFGDWDNEDEEEEAFKSFLNRPSLTEETPEEFNPYLESLYQTGGSGEVVKLGAEKPLFGATEGTEYLSKPSLIQRFGNKIQDFKGSLQKIKGDINDSFQSMKDSLNIKDPFQQIAAQKSAQEAENEAVSEATKQQLFKNVREPDPEPEPEPEEEYEYVRPPTPPPGHDWQKGTYENPEPAPPEQDLSSYEQSLIDAHRSGAMHAEGSQQYEDWQRISGAQKGPQEGPQEAIEEQEPEYTTKGGYKIPKFPSEDIEEDKSEFSETAEEALKKAQFEKPDEYPNPEEAALGEDIGVDAGVEEAALGAGEASLAIPGVGEVVGAVGAAVGAGVAIYGGVKYLQSHPDMFPDIGSDIGQFGKLISGGQSYSEFQHNLKNPFSTPEPSMPHRIQMATPSQAQSNLTGDYVGAGVAGQTQF